MNGYDLLEAMQRAEEVAARHAGDGDNVLGFP